MSEERSSERLSGAAAGGRDLEAKPDHDLVLQSIELPGGPLRIWQPSEAAELPDDGAVEWAPIAPFSAVLWRSGVALAGELEERDLRGRRIVELGCGLGVPSIAAARTGADVLATDMDAEAIELLGRNAAENGVALETAVAAWSDPEEIVERGPFDLVVAADVLYERQSVGPLLSLLPRLAPDALIVDPGRPASHAFIEQAERRWDLRPQRMGVVSLYALRLAPPRGSSA
jgi:predicted nicotinamide N-methyase